MMDKIILGVLILVLALLLSFLLTAGFVALICWAFALTFTWKVAFGTWIVLIVVKGLVAR